MGIHPASLFALQPEALAETRQDMWHWAEAVIADCAAACYDKAMPSRLSSNLLAKKHCRLWQAAVGGQADALTLARLDLRRTSEKFGLKAASMAEVNAVILEELFDIMLFRYKGSARSTKAATMILMAASTGLNADGDGAAAR